MKKLALVLAAVIATSTLAGCTGQPLNMDNGVFVVEEGVLTEYNGDGGDVAIPDGVTSIGGAFDDCDGLTSITIPDSVTSIDGSFRDCDGLTSITIPDSVTSIDGSFRDCDNLTNISISNNTISIGANSFSNTPWLENQTDEFVIVGDGVLIGYNGNGGYVKIPNNVKYIADYVFSDNKKLKIISIGNSAISIGNHAFQGCGLTRAIIYDGVTSIGINAFSDCKSLTEVTIPDSVTYIAGSHSGYMGDAFNGCNNLTNATYKGKTYSYNNIDYLYGAINNNN